MASGDHAFAGAATTRSDAILASGGHAFAGAATGRRSACVSQTTRLFERRAKLHPTRPRPRFFRSAISQKLRASLRTPFRGRVRGRSWGTESPPPWLDGARVCRRPLACLRGERWGVEEASRLTPYSRSVGSHAFAGAATTRSDAILASGGCGRQDAVAPWERE